MSVIGWFVIAALVGLLVSIGALFLGGEWLVPWLLPVSAKIPAGFMRSFAFATLGRSFKYSNPRILIIREPRPVAFAIRSFWGRGLILVSQGAVSTQSPEQLSGLLRESAIRLETRSVVWESAGSVVALLLSRMLPLSWFTLVHAGRSSSDNLSTPMATLWFLMVYPCFRYLVGLSASRQVTGDSQVFYHDPQLVNLVARR